MEVKVGDYYLYDKGNGNFQIEKIVRVDSEKFRYLFKHEYWTTEPNELRLDYITKEGSYYTKVHPILVKLWRLDE